MNASSSSYQETQEINFDGLVGPTHHYGGLSYGNLASMSHEYSPSNPKAAAKQGLAKMAVLMRLGIGQGLFPPHERPNLPFLRNLGYSGENAEILKHVRQQSPLLLSVCCSSAGMWTANTATICPSADTTTPQVHLTPANLISTLHRSLEPEFNEQLLKKIFSNPKYFVHHHPLLSHLDFADEGAANHTRFCRSYGEPGVHLFVFGRHAFDKKQSHPLLYPARQTLEASQAITRLHQLPPNRVVFAQQHPCLIDKGVFHNDVIAVGNQLVFFYHEKAFLETTQVIQSLKEKIQATCQADLICLQVLEEQVPVQEAITSYLFNSQLVTLPNQTMALIAPIECQQVKNIQTYFKQLLSDSSHPIKQIIYQDLRQSMQNGGGPACLRLRIVLTAEEKVHVHPQVLLTENLYLQLEKWIDKHYRDHLQLLDLADPHLLLETQQALDELTQILQLGSIYTFQKQ